MRGFWNDPEGISITDFLALSFSGVYVVLLALSTTKLLRGTLTAVDVSFLQVITWPSLTILGGYYGGEFINYLRSRPPNKAQTGTAAAESILDPRLLMPLPTLGVQAVITSEEIERADADGGV